MGWDHISILQTYLSSSLEKHDGIGADVDKLKIENANCVQNIELGKNEKGSMYVQVLTSNTVEQAMPHNNMNN